MERRFLDQPDNPAARSPSEVLAEWRRLERLLDAGLDEDEQQQILLRVLEVKAEYRSVTERVREVAQPPSTLEPAKGGGLAG
jgi:hypothetical protein